MRPLLMAVLLVPSFATGGAVKRAVFADLERKFDQRLERALPDDSFLLLGSARGIYLERYGAVFTTEINLVNSPTISPFRQTIPKEDVARLHAKKQQRIPVLRKTLEDILVSMAAALDDVPAGEQVVVGVTLFYFSWEDTAGLPTQVLAQGERRKLIDVLAKRSPASSVVTVREF